MLTSVTIKRFNQIKSLTDLIKAASLVVSTNELYSSYATNYTDEEKFVELQLAKPPIFGPRVHQLWADYSVLICVDGVYDFVDPECPIESI